MTCLFAKARKIDTEPAFCWWVPFTLKNKDMIIAAVQSQLKFNSHKYGIEVPRDETHAYEIDVKNGNTLWQDAHKKEMYNVSVAFEILEYGQKVLLGWKKTSRQLILDIKMDFTRKSRWVKDGH